MGISQVQNSHKINENLIKNVAIKWQKMNARAKQVEYLQHYRIIYGKINSNATLKSMLGEEAHIW